ncbi:electron transport complex subunit RsxG [Solemya velesiana gill symbiont]|uniref:Ion-translocating oxidoreductase complex subunit G n=1 Tax=Solemya velesiana gill symbiont TaxID=1918948 RepID=A0A1T2KV68_9GAMM|nr:electron transport complex subunit RsxG [Solemya velesiana gill symbiont]OOZ36630.1 electron transporter RnfG [Solemya velesiana gill symbiont]
MNKYPILVAGLLLAMFAVAGTGLVAFTQEQTKDRIAANEREALLRSLNALVPADSIDNDIVTDTRFVNDIERLGGDKIQVYLGRKGGQPVAAVFASVVPDGYSGPIKLLVAVRTDGSLGGVRIVSHKETPGLGDKVEERKSDWVYSFKDKSLINPDISRWKVKRDGGDFDQFTGATVTPRSIVGAVKNTLLYFRDKGMALFERPSDNEAPPEKVASTQV